MAYIDCLAKGGAQILEKPPVDASVLSPYVKITFNSINSSNVGSTITVGNKSAPDNNNTAVISDFQFGENDATIVKVKIHDQEGSSFVKFMENLIKDMKCTSSAQFSEIEFGWIKLNCNNSVGFDRSPTFLLIANAIDCSFQDGRIMYEVEFTDSMNRHAEGRCAVIYGSNDNEMHITEAIRSFLTDTNLPPSVSDVVFKKITFNNKGVPTFTDIRWKYPDSDDATKGPKGVWASNNLDKLNTVKGWLGTALSEDDKSFIVLYDPTIQGGRITIIEDPKSNCSNTPFSSSVSTIKPILQYVVNAGKESPVISFNPNFRFTWGALASSGGNNGTKNASSNSEGSKATGHDCLTLSRKYIKTGGVQQSNAGDRNAFDKFNKQETDLTQEKAQKQQLLANFTAAIDPSIKADLVIIGDPSLEPYLLKDQYIGLTFINPFHLSPSGDSCGEWMALPLCNEVLGNDKWRIDGISHSITADGKFTTTIRIWLEAPGVQLNVDEPFGGFGSTGWTPPVQC